MLQLTSIVILIIWSLPHSFNMYKSIKTIYIYQLNICLYIYKLNITVLILLNFCISKLSNLLIQKLSLSKHLVLMFLSNCKL